MGSKRVGHDWVTFTSLEENVLKLIKGNCESLTANIIFHLKSGNREDDDLTISLQNFTENFSQNNK